MRHAHGVVQTGARNAISDLTPAGGYILLDCHPTSSLQTIRAICVMNSTAGTTCSHITQNGAADTVVRLPDNVRLAYMLPRKRY
jgi:hypothetical protein